MRLFRRRLAQIAISLVSALAVLALVPPSAQSLIGPTSSVTGGDLLVTGTSGGETISVDCNASYVKINGSDPGTGSATCASIVTIKVNAGGGADKVVLYTDAGGWPAVTSIVVNGQDGNDKLVGGKSGDTLKGGAGKDTINGNEGNDKINGGSGIDNCNGGPGTDTITNCE